MFTTRLANENDFYKIYSLYKKVASEKIGIARSSEEITENYIHAFMKNASGTGIELVVENPSNANRIIAEIHCYKLTPKVFSHLLSELTIVVDQDFHGKGLGKMIFKNLLDTITETRPDILRVELVAQESNGKAIALYKKVGFNIEGRFEKRIRTSGNNFEADLPMAWINPNFIG
ncbi:MAG: GNAT family N-acetyltransferase [Ferruginibacter sp.]